jgi:hypothetical protein
MKILKAAFLLAGVLMASQLYADTSGCTLDFSLCSVFEDGQVLSFDGISAAGDIVIDDSSGVVSDVFRIFNDFFDSGGGTGLGVSAFLYSSDEHDLPDPSTYSVNAVFLKEGPNIGGTDLRKTVYIGAFGTEFDIYSAETPEPAMVPIWSGLGCMACIIAWRQRRRSLSGV